jgi:hypothetical protein
MSGYIHRIFRRFKPGDPVAAVANVHDDDLIKNFIEGLHGVGCRVVKNPAGGLRDTRIIVDGTSDDGSEITADMEAARLDSLAQAQSQFPYGSKWPWGIAISGAVVSVYNGRIPRYPNTYTATNPTEITFTEAGDFWVGYLFESQTNTLTITGPLASEPVSSAADVADGIYRGALFKFTVTDDGEDEPTVTGVSMVRDYVHGRMDLQITT